MAYYFYRLFEVDIDSWNGKKLITDDVIIAPNRESAKKLIIQKHGDFPFRKTKMMISGEKYYYLTNSNEYWYKFHHEKYHLKCDVCGKEFDIEGSRNLYSFKNKHATYCSNRCKETIIKLVKQNNPWINLKTSGKFDNYNISDLVFEVLEIVVYDEKNPTDTHNYVSKEDKLAHREMFYITHNQTINYGFNKMLEKSKIEDQLKLKLFEEMSEWPDE